MTVESAKFTRKKEQAIANLLQHPTIAQAAEATGVAEVTLFRWLQDSRFADMYRQVRREVVSQAIAQLQQAAGEAVRNLREVMNKPTMPGAVRTRAAQAVLEMALKATEIQDLEERIARLEEHAERRPAA